MVVSLFATAYGYSCGKYSWKTLDSILNSFFCELCNRLCIADRTLVDLSSNANVVPTGAFGLPCPVFI